MNTSEVPPGRYRVIYSTDGAGGHTDFSAADDQAAWESAERSAHGARIVELARVQTGLVDREQRLERPASPQLPDFPRPDLPSSHPENYPTLKIRVLRRLGLPDDGGLWLSDAIDSDVLRGYAGIVITESADFLLIQFASLGCAVSWAESITAQGRDRSMVSLASDPANPYSPAVIKVRLR